MTFERWTDRSRKVMQLANQEALRLNHEYVGTEHILIGLIKEGSGVACNVLKDLGVSLDRVICTVRNQLRPGPEMVLMGKLPLTLLSRKVIEHAAKSADELGFKYVGDESLLVGLLREPEGVACRVLTALGIDALKVEAEICLLLTPKREEPQHDGLGRFKQMVADEMSKTSMIDVEQQIIIVKAACEDQLAMIDQWHKRMRQGVIDWQDAQMIYLDGLKKMLTPKPPQMQPEDATPTFGLTKMNFPVKLPCQLSSGVWIDMDGLSGEGLSPNEQLSKNRFDACERTKIGLLGGRLVVEELKVQIAEDKWKLVWCVFPCEVLQLPGNNDERMKHLGVVAPHQFADKINVIFHHAFDRSKGPGLEMLARKLVSDAFAQWWGIEDEQATLRVDMDGIQDDPNTAIVGMDGGEPGAKFDASPLEQDTAKPHYGMTRDCRVLGEARIGYQRREVWQVPKETIEEVVKPKTWRDQPPMP